MAVGSPSGDVARPVGHAVFRAAPPRLHAVRRLRQDGFDTVNLSFFNLEQLAQLPGPRRRWTGGHRTPGRRREMARVAAHVVEKGEAEDEPTLLIDGDVPPIANTRHEVQQPGLELLAAAPLSGVIAR